jgi:hypothetical protein
MHAMHQISFQGFPLILEAVSWAFANPSALGPVNFLDTQDSMR